MRYCPLALNTASDRPPVVRRAIAECWRRRLDRAMIDSGDIGLARNDPRARTPVTGGAGTWLPLEKVHDPTTSEASPRQSTVFSGLRSTTRVLGFIWIDFNTEATRGVLFGAAAAHPPRRQTPMPGGSTATIPVDEALNDHGQMRSGRIWPTAGRRLPANPMPTLTSLSPSGTRSAAGLPVDGQWQQLRRRGRRSLERIGSPHEFHQPHAAAGNDTSK